MKPFIKACEIWAPSRSGLELEFVTGHYGDLVRLKEVSEKKAFHYDQGLPGKAWASRHPIVLDDLQNSYFERSQEAAESGITTAIAMPVFAGQCLLAVMILFCGDDNDVAGAIELWHCDEKVSYDLEFLSGYFGKLDHFEFLSKHTSFRRGTGLPGIVWESRMPKLLPDLGRSHRFIRSESAAEAGITTGLGIPFLDIFQNIYVMTFLSALGTPIARQIELWTPSFDNTFLLFTDGCTVNQFDLIEQYREVHIPQGEGVLGRTFLTGMPEISTDPDQVMFSKNIAAREFNMTSMITFPVLENGFCKCIVALHS